MFNGIKSREDVLGTSGCCSIAGGGIYYFSFGEGGIYSEVLF